MQSCNRLLIFFPFCRKTTQKSKPKSKQRQKVMEAESQDSDLEVTEELESLGQEKDEAKGSEEEGKFSFSF